ncbi:MAG TPA: hypothetical protein VF668_11120 [Pyrinomonadaceae bacterium]|jgi:hypothetical protein
MKKSLLKFAPAGGGVALLFFVLALGGVAAQAQGRSTIGRWGGKVVDVKVGQLTLESVDFREQTARLSLGLEVSNSLVPVTLKDFDYRLRLAGQDAVEGRYDGSLKIRKGSRVELPVVVHLRSIPGVVWSAFRNGGRVGYELDSAFTVPLFVTERRFDQSFSGEVPLRSLVDAATVLRASRAAGGRGDGGRILGDIWPF